MIICLLYALVALVIALICIILIEWGGLSLIGANPPAQVLTLIRLLVGLLWLIYVIGCLSVIGFNGFRFYPWHP